MQKTKLKKFVFIANEYENSRISNKDNLTSEKLINSKNKPTSLLELDNNNMLVGSAYQAAKYNYNNYQLNEKLKPQVYEPSNNHQKLQPKQIPSSLKFNKSNEISSKDSPNNYRKTNNFTNAYNNEDYYYYDNPNFNSSRNNNYQNNSFKSPNYSSPSNSTIKKPYVGITAETRTRKIHTLNMIRSTKMPTGSMPTNSDNHIVIVDKYNNKLVLPVAKF